MLSVLSNYRNRSSVDTKPWAPASSREEASNASSLLRSGDTHSALEVEADMQSALSVLGKALPSSNVERVDLKIHDPDNSLRSKRKRNRVIQDGDTTGDEGSDDELSRGIEAYLVMKLVCKHGKLAQSLTH